MARQLHHRKKDNKYALWSTVIDDYVTTWDTKENIKQYWINEKVEKVIQDVNKWMEEIDKEVF